MGNFRDPTVIAQDLLAAMKFWHAIAGLYIWEFVTTLDYEWSVIRGRRPYRWTIIMYSATRVATLVAVIICLVSSDATAYINCQVETIFQYLSGYLAVVTASFLIVLRIIAIWNRKKCTMAIAAGVWVTNLAFLIYSVVQIRATWAHVERTCLTVNILSTKLNMIMIFITDIVLLLIMLIGLLRLGSHGSGVRGMAHLMWTQGLVWLFLATIAYVPPMVLISLDLNDPLNHMFQLSAVITTTIAATRIHRSLVDASSRSTDMLHPIVFATSKTNQVPAPPMTLETIDLAIHETYEQYQTSQTRQYFSFIGGEESQCDKLAGHALDYDLERDVEVGT